MNDTFEIVKIAKEFGFDKDETISMIYSEYAQRPPFVFSENEITYMGCILAAGVLVDVLKLYYNKKKV